MPEKVVSGVYAAVSTPRDAAGAVDARALRFALKFLMEQGIRGFALNGATGEYCLTSPEELRTIVEAGSEATAGRAEFVCGIGAAGIVASVENGRIAIEGGAKGLLLPMPHFFPYEQDDLDAFCRAAAEQLPVPILLYNLPVFTTPLDAPTVLRLVADCPNIVGIKDSSGSLGILRALTESGLDACRIVGNDAVLAGALREGVCDGVISGVAYVLPELLLALYAEGQTPETAEFGELSRRLDEFIGAVGGFPVPWALKWIAESRAIAPLSFSQPLSPRRREQGRELQEWFRNWHAAAEASV
jgi:4-hydroxy-tetrahydrodipicolinate synthase